MAISYWHSRVSGSMPVILKYKIRLLEGLLEMEAVDLIKGSVKLATLPEVFTKINEMVDDPSSSASDIGKFISQDPGLTARLLKIANSPLYGFPSRIDTVSRAITIIGTRGLRDLILATSVINSFTRMPGDHIDMHQFWSHSLYCGVIARLIAVKCNALHTEPFFVSGLLHDIGQLIILNKLPEISRETRLRANDGGMLLHEVEQEVLGFDHAKVGCELLRDWRLPDTIIDSTEFHHEPGKAELSPLGASIVHIASELAIDAETQSELSSGEFITTRVAPVAVAITGLSESVIDNIKEEAALQFSAAVELFLPKVV